MKYIEYTLTSYEVEMLIESVFTKQREIAFEIEALKGNGEDTYIKRKEMQDYNKLISQLDSKI